MIVVMNVLTPSAPISQFCKLKKLSTRFVIRKFVRPINPVFFNLLLLSIIDWRLCPVFSNNISKDSSFKLQSFNDIFIRVLFFFKAKHRRLHPLREMSLLLKSRDMIDVFC